MRTSRAIAVLLGAMIAFLSSLHGAEYFVAKQGSDASNGTSRTTAFLTVQKGVDALKPGDTLTIGPGEYFENVERADLGSADADTLIRAEVPGTVLLRGDVEAPQFKKVEGHRFVYAAPFDQTPQAVLEHDSLTILLKRPNRRALEYDPGTFTYDEDQKKLYMSSSDLREPGSRRYTVAVTGKHGIHLAKPQRVVIEGLAASGFYSAWGMLLDAPVSCTLRGCVTYLCQGGICLGKHGAHNLIENCESYGHLFGGIVRYYADDDTIRNCRTYETKREGGDEHFGIMHYHRMSGPLLLQNNISWGQRFDFSVKPSQQERLENCIALGPVRNAKMFNNIIGGGNEYDRNSTNATADNILFLREKNLDRDSEFADPLNLDFRLQPHSRFRGTGPDGSDRGPYPYRASVFYVSSAGDDAADGLSMRSPWRTLTRAFKDLKPGDTLYLAEGEYGTAPLHKLGDGTSPVAIRGRGRGIVVLAGPLDLTDGTGVVLERLSFNGSVTVSNSRDVAFGNCTFFGTGGGLKADNVAGLRVTHSVFANVPLRVAGSKTVTLTGNIYANDGKPAVLLDSDAGILYSDYNGYRDAARCWKVDGATWTLADLQKRHGRYSQIRVPRFTSVRGVPRVDNRAAFNSRGPHSTALGIHYAYSAAPRPLQLVGPFLHSVSDKSANIEWWTSEPATFDLAWGETPGMKNRVKNVQAPDRFTTYSLTGLQPGTKYYFQIRSADTSGRGTAYFATVLKPGMEPLSFTTSAVAPKASVYYVAPDGNDGNTGLSREQAWRTVSHAADRVHAGDTVLIAGGTYHEDVRIRATGEDGKPIAFRCIPGEKVVFNGKDLMRGFKAVVKKNLTFDGFYFVDFRGAPKGVFVLWQGHDVRITRCFNVKGTGYGGFVSAEYSSNLLVKNCVAAAGMSPIALLICPDWRVENNLFLRPYITAVYSVNKPEQKGYLSRNIITDGLPYKSHAPLLSIGRFESLVDKDNCYFLRLPEEERKLFEFYGTAAYGRYHEYGVTTDFEKPPVIKDNPDGTENNPRMTLKEYQAMAGDTGSFAGDPGCAGTANMEPGGKLWTGDPATLFDKLLGKKDLDFPDTFATDPKALEKGIGPEPDAFKDFWFNRR